jgi:hypothetical protein
VVSIVVFLHGGRPGALWTDYVERAFEQEVHRFNYVSFGAKRRSTPCCASPKRTPEVEAMEMTWAEQQAVEYQKKFREEGIVLGLEKGREQGREQGVRSTLLRLLGQRFGEVPPPIRARVEEIDSLDELDGLVDRILEVKSLDELGLGS